ncbi:MAG: orotate phosphoribosyltransferase [Acidilobaceae archaeon]
MSRVCELAEAMVERRALMVGEFTLTSGRKSRFYLDLRRLLGDPESFSRTVEMLLDKARELEPYETVVGLATAGIPWATAIALLSGKKLAYARSEVKEHGTRSSVEGLLEGEETRCILVDDVATTGGTIERAARTLRDSGVCRVEAALVILDRLQGARENLEKAGVKLHAVATIADVVECLAKRGLLDEKTAEAILSETRQTKS